MVKFASRAIAIHIAMFTKYRCLFLIYLLITMEVGISYIITYYNYTIPVRQIGSERYITDIDKIY